MIQRCILKSSYLFLPKSIHLSFIRFCSHEHAREWSTSIFDHSSAPYPSIRNEINEGRQSVLIASVYPSNISNAIENFENRNNRQVVGATYFHDNTGVSQNAKKTCNGCLMLKLSEPMFPTRRILNYHFRKNDLQSRSPKKIKRSHEDVLPRAFSPLVLNGCETVSEQIRTLYECKRMNPKVKLFHGLVISCLQDILESRDENLIGEILPFGSAPSGLAMQGSADLDLMYIPSNKKIPLKLQLRKAGNYFRSAGYEATFILRAAVPIVRLLEKRTHLVMDISVTSRDGPVFTSLMSAMNEYDDRVFPLIMTLKFWSKVNQLSNIHFSNFTLASLVVFFLQQKDVIPPFNYFLDVLAGKHSLDSFKTENKQSLENLLTQFFQFYSGFNFAKDCIILTEGRSERIQNHTHRTHLYMNNPFRTSPEDEKLMNIGRIVKKESLDDFKRVCDISLIKLGEGNVKEKSREWGLNVILPC